LSDGHVEAPEHAEELANDEALVSLSLERAEERLGIAGKEGSPQSAFLAVTPSESIVVFDFGSQYSQLIARRVREQHVYCELVPADAPWEYVSRLNPKGFILSGGPASVYEEGAPKAPNYVFESGLPVLGICYGLQLMAQQLGGRVEPASEREYGRATVHIEDRSASVFKGLPTDFPAWMSHGDRISQLPPGFRILAYSDNSPVATMGRGGLIGFQFHPEVVHTPHGTLLLRNFLFEICGCQGSWTPASFIDESEKRIRETVGDGRVICALSGGVDSAVTAALIHRAVGNQLTCVFVNNGLLRLNEPEQVIETFQRNLRINLVYVDATESFMSLLRGVEEPERKRKIIGREFIRVFEREALKLGKVDFLGQGTLYPDVIESRAPERKAAALIKTHHNVGGLPSDMPFRLIEPLRYLFKDEVRAVGLALGLPEEMVYRQPFPGPGLAIRIVGEVTPERLDLLRRADAIVVEEIKQAGLYRELWQSFAVLTPVRTVGVMGDFRTYGYLVAVRAVVSTDAMTADWAQLPYDVLGRISSRLVNEVAGINRVVYDITSKPPSTIEWE